MLLLITAAAFYVYRPKSSLVVTDSPTGVSQTTLDLSNKQLDKLPSYVLNMNNLQILNLSNNNLTGAFPAEIRHLKNLKELIVSNNKMTGVPAEIGQLESLEILDLSNNLLTGLPYEMANLKKLRILNLSGNKYSTADLEIIKKGLPAFTKIIY